MQLKMMTDYAIRVLIYMTGRKMAVTRQEIAAATGITERPLITTLRRLRDTGWVESSIGAEGGWRLIINLDHLSLLDVMRITEDTIRFNRCLEDDQFCSRNAADACPLHEVYERYQEMIEAYFSAITIDDLMNPAENRQERNPHIPVELE